MLAQESQGLRAIITAAIDEPENLLNTFQLADRKSIAL